MAREKTPPVWLLGAGSSLAAGMPSTSDLTQLVWNTHDAVRVTQGVFVVGREVPGVLFAAEWMKAIHAALSEADCLIRRYYPDARHRSNYEELAYLLGQVDDAESGEYDNPAVLPMIWHLECRLREHLDLLSDLHDSEITLHRLAWEARNYVTDVVSHALRQQPRDLNALNAVADCCRTLANTGPVRLFTLNHDTVLESALHNAGLPVIDGFEDRDGDVRFWSPSALESDAAGVYLHKLHGSVAWHRVRLVSRAADPRKERLAVVCARDWRTLQNGRAEQLEVVGDGRPHLLVGTFNKMLEYTSGAFLTMLNRFFDTLNRSTRLIVCGYGFRDKGINRVLINWMDQGRGRRLVVIDPHASDAAKKSRGAIQKAWPAWRRSKRLRVVEKSIAEESWSDIEEALRGT